MFPRETVEKILAYCDGTTLLSAKFVNEDWKQSVDYLSKKFKIWETCCLEEIPQDELIEYLEKYKGQKEDGKYMDIYANWHVWKSVEEKVDFELIRSPAEVPRITCIAVSDVTSGRYIAVGSEDGRIRVFNDRWELVFTDRHLSVKITEISFVQDNGTLYRQSELPYLIVHYKCSTLYLIDYVKPLVVRDVILFSAFNIYMCFVKRGGRVSIARLCRTDSGERIFCEINYVRIYSPDEVTSVRIWNGTCTFLMNSEVKILTYDTEIAPITTIKNKTKLNYCDKTTFYQQRSCYIYRTNIILSLSKDKFNDQLLELFILWDDHEISKRIFNTWDVFHSNITCMFLYGNTFVLGFDHGCVYFYHIQSWELFEINKYDQCVIIGKHPIISIDVRESAGERKFYVASSFNIHEVIGFTVVNLNP